MTESLKQDEAERAAALEQAELRRRLQHSVEQEQARRQDAPPPALLDDEPPVPPPARQWQPPRDAAGADPGWRIMLRLVVFGVVVFAGYLAMREISYRVFGPELSVLAPVVPAGAVAVGEPVMVGAHVVNRSRRSDGAAFAVAVFADGTEREGGTVDVPPGDTVFVPIELRLGRGEHVFTLVVYDAWRGTRQLTSIRGLSVGAVAREIEVSDVRAPARVAPGAPFAVEFAATNPGAAAERAVAVVALQSAAGTALVLEGPETTLEAGQTRTLRVDVPAPGPGPGRYVASVHIRSAAGTLLGQARFPVPIDVLP